MGHHAFPPSPRAPRAKKNLHLPALKRRSSLPPGKKSPLREPGFHPAEGCLLQRTRKKECFPLESRRDPFPGEKEKKDLREKWILSGKKQDSQVEGSTSERRFQHRPQRNETPSFPVVLGGWKKRKIGDRWKRKNGEIRSGAERTLRTPKERKVRLWEEKPSSESILSFLYLKC